MVVLLTTLSYEVQVPISNTSTHTSHSEWQQEKLPQNVLAIKLLTLNV